MEKVSIIIPVFNGEKCIGRCLDSIINQTIKKFEIIIIDDSSTDNTKGIIDKYIKEYNTEKEIIKYIYKEKTTVGNGLARNIGIENATSKYVMFIDSDDYIENDLIEKLEQYMEQDIDLIKYKLKRVKINGELISIVDGATFDKCSGQEAFNKLYSTDVLLDSPCVYMYKKDLFIRNNLKFMDDVYHEDFGMIPITIVCAKTVISLNYVGYYYVQEEGSITRNADYLKTVKKANDVFKHYDNMINLINKLKLDKITCENIKIYYTNAIILKINELKKEDQKKHVKEMKKRKMINNIKARNIKQFLKVILLKINVILYAKLKK